MKKCILPFLALLLLGACSTAEPLQTLTRPERAAMFSALRGEYIVIDSRNNDWNISSLWIYPAETNGMVFVTYDQDKSFRRRLTPCAIASKTQAENLGNPLDSLENLIHCKIPLHDQEGEMYIGRLRENYTLNDHGIIKTDDPFTIKGEYLITLRLDSRTMILSTIKKSKTIYSAAEKPTPPA